MKLFLAALLCASFGPSVVKKPGPSPSAPSNVFEWCAQPAAWSATHVVSGATVWTVEGGLSYVPSSNPAGSGVLWAFGSLGPLPNGGLLSLYLQLPYPCTAADPTTAIPVVNWLDPVLGWIHASIQKPSGPTWPEAIQADLVTLVVQ